MKCGGFRLLFWLIANRRLKNGIIRSDGSVESRSAEMQEIANARSASSNVVDTKKGSDADDSSAEPDTSTNTTACYDRSWSWDGCFRLLCGHDYQRRDQKQNGAFPYFHRMPLTATNGASVNAGVKMHRFAGAKVHQ